MPIKKVIPVEVTIRGKRMWRVIIPIELTNGERRTRFFKVKEDADEFARATERDRCLEFPKEFYSYQQGDQSEILKARKIAGSGPRLLAAAEYYEKHFPQIGSSLPISDLVDSFIESKEQAQLSAKYIKKFRWSLGNFRHHIGVNLIQDVSPEDVEAWINSNTWTKTTKRGALIDLGVFFSWAVERRHASRNPVLMVTKPRTSDAPPTILSPKEVRLLLNRVKVIDPGLIRYFALRIFGGLRESEAVTISPERIKAESVEVYSKKTHQRRLVTQNKPLKAWLKLGGDWPLVNLKHRIEKIYKSDPPLKIPANSMRHSFCTYSFAIHGPGRTAAESGHSEGVLHRFYKELVPVREAKEFFSILPESSVR
jgi:integrase